MSYLLSRRNFLTLAGSALAMPAIATPVMALNETQARALIQSLVDRINSVISSGKSENAMYSEFERIFRSHADISYVAAYAMGNDGRRASASQKRAFSDAFTGYISRKYGKRFREFIGGRLEVQGVRQVKNYYEVTAIAFLRGEAPFEVAFHVSDRSGKDLFFNMYIEGINMLLTERAEVGAMLDKRRGDIDAMIGDLRRSG